MLTKNIKKGILSIKIKKVGMNMKKYEEIRREREYFPAVKNSSYFETASTGLIPQYVYDATKRYQDNRLYVGGDSTWGEAQTGSIEMMDLAKESLARLLNCKSDEVVFGANTSSIMAYYTANIDLPEDSNVVMAENTYTSGRYLWQIREKEGLEIRYAKVADGRLRPEALFDLTDEHTVAIHCDYVESSTGFLLEAERIGSFCKERGIRFIVDATQALGAMPVDVQKIHADLAAGNNYKWMLGYCGTGFGYISRNLWDDIAQKAAGWMSDQYRFYKDSPHVILRNDAGRFELGYPNMPGIYGLKLTADTYNRLGAETVKDYLMYLREYLTEKIEAAPGLSLRYQFAETNYSQIIHVLADQSLHLTYEQLKAAGVMCNVCQDEETTGTRLRIGLHYYNNEEDIDKLFAVISKAAE